MNKLIIRNLKVEVEGKEIIKGVDLTIDSKSTHAIMGVNGSGKSTLSYTIAGHPKYKITDGEILLDVDGTITKLNDLPVEERARLGLFLAAQLPTEVDGVSLSKFLRAAVGAVQGELPPIREWVKTLEKEMDFLKIDKSFANRYLNVGFSGGEKKRTEILQLRLLKPKFTILDETDSGLDVDALKVVAKGINDARNDLSFGTLLITHHTHLLEYVKPDFVHIFSDGKIVKSGDANLAEDIVKDGYSRFVI